MPALRVNSLPCASDSVRLVVAHPSRPHRVYVCQRSLIVEIDVLSGAVYATLRPCERLPPSIQFVQLHAAVVPGKRDGSTWVVALTSQGVLFVWRPTGERGSSSTPRSIIPIIKSKERNRGGVHMHKPRSGSGSFDANNTADLGDGDSITSSNDMPSSFFRHGTKGPVALASSTVLSSHRLKRKLMSLSHKHTPTRAATTTTTTTTPTIGVGKSTGNLLPMQTETSTSNPQLARPELARTKSGGPGGRSRASSANNTDMYANNTDTFKRQPVRQSISVSLTNGMPQTHIMFTQVSTGSLSFIRLSGTGDASSLFSDDEDDGLEVTTTSANAGLSDGVNSAAADVGSAKKIQRTMTRSSVDLSSSKSITKRRTQGLGFVAHRFGCPHVAVGSPEGFKVWEFEAETMGSKKAWTERCIVEAPGATDATFHKSLPLVFAVFNNTLAPDIPAHGLANGTNTARRSRTNSAESDTDGNIPSPSLRGSSAPVPTNTSSSSTPSFSSKRKASSNTSSTYPQILGAWLMNMNASGGGGGASVKWAVVPALRIHLNPLCYTFSLHPLWPVVVVPDSAHTLALWRFSAIPLPPGTAIASTCPALPLAQLNLTLPAASKRPLQLMKEFTTSSLLALCCRGVDVLTNCSTRRRSSTASTTGNNPMRTKIGDRALLKRPQLVHVGLDVWLSKVLGVWVKPVSHLHCISEEHELNHHKLGLLQADADFGMGFGACKWRQVRHAVAEDANLIVRQVDLTCPHSYSRAYDNNSARPSSTGMQGGRVGAGGNSDTDVVPVKSILHASTGILLILLATVGSGTIGEDDERGSLSRSRTNTMRSATNVSTYADSASSSTSGGNYVLKLVMPKVEETISNKVEDPSLPLLDLNGSKCRDAIFVGNNMIAMLLCTTDSCNKNNNNNNRTSTDGNGGGGTCLVIAPLTGPSAGKSLYRATAPPPLELLSVHATPFAAGGNSSSISTRGRDTTVVLYVAWDHDSQRIVLCFSANLSSQCAMYDFAPFIGGRESRASRVSSGVYLAGRTSTTSIDGPSDNVKSRSNSSIGGEALSDVFGPMGNYASDTLQTDDDVCKPGVLVLRKNETVLQVEWEPINNDGKPCDISAWITNPPQESEPAAATVCGPRLAIVTDMGVYMCGARGAVGLLHAEFFRAQHLTSCTWHPAGVLIVIDARGQVSYVPTTITQAPLYSTTNSAQEASAANNNNNNNTACVRAGGIEDRVVVPLCSVDMGGHWGGPAVLLGICDDNLIYSMSFAPRHRSPGIVRLGGRIVHTAGVGGSGPLVQVYRRPLLLADAIQWATRRKSTATAAKLINMNVSNAFKTTSDTNAQGENSEKEGQMTSVCREYELERVSVINPLVDHTSIQVPALGDRFWLHALATKDDHAFSNLCRAAHAASGGNLETIFQRRHVSLPIALAVLERSRFVETKPLFNSSVQHLIDVWTGAGDSGVSVEEQRAVGTAVTMVMTGRRVAVSASRIADKDSNCKHVGESVETRCVVASAGLSAACGVGAGISAFASPVEMVEEVAAWTNSPFSNVRTAMCSALDNKTDEQEKKTGPNATSALVARMAKRIALKNQRKNVSSNEWDGDEVFGVLPLPSMQGKESGGEHARELLGGPVALANPSALNKIRFGHSSNTDPVKTNAGAAAVDNPTVLFSERRVEVESFSQWFGSAQQDRYDDQPEDGGAWGGGQSGDANGCAGDLEFANLLGYWRFEDERCRDVAAKTGCGVGGIGEVELRGPSVRVVDTAESCEMLDVGNGLKVPRAQALLLPQTRDYLAIPLPSGSSLARSLVSALPSTRIEEAGSLDENGIQDGNSDADDSSVGLSWAVEMWVRVRKPKSALEGVLCCRRACIDGEELVDGEKDERGWSISLDADLAVHVRLGSGHTALGWCTAVGVVRCGTEGDAWTHVCVTVRLKAMGEREVELLVDGEVCHVRTEDNVVGVRVGGECVVEGSDGDGDELAIGLGLEDIEVTELRLWSCARDQTDVAEQMRTYLGVAQSQRRIMVVISDTT